MNEKTIAAKISEFAAAHPDAVVCAMYHRAWRQSEKLIHSYFVVKDGQPARVPAYRALEGALPRYTLDLERGAAWRDFTVHDLFSRRLAREHINEAYLSDQEYAGLWDACAIEALRMNRWLKNRRIAALRREGKLR